MMANIMEFTDSIGDVFEIRHIIKVSKRRKGARRIAGQVYYETNDGKWYSKSEFINPNVDALKEGDIIATRISDGASFAVLLNQFNSILNIEGLPNYDHKLYTVIKELPKGL